MFVSRADTTERAALSRIETTAIGIGIYVVLANLMWPKRAGSMVPTTLLFVLSFQFCPLS